MGTNRQFAVLGLGSFGESVVKTLIDNGCEVLGCDIDMNAVQEVAKFATHVVQVDTTDELALSSLGLGNFDVVIVATGDNLEASILATMVAKESGAKYILAKAQTDMQKKILEKVGADSVILPEWEMGFKVANHLSSSNVIDIINLSDEYTLAEITPPDLWVGRTLSKANIRNTTGLNIIAIKRGKKIIISPKAEQVIEKEDILVAIGEVVDIHHFRRDRFD